MPLTVCADEVCSERILDEQFSDRRPAFLHYDRRCIAVVIVRPVDEAQRQRKEAILCEELVDFEHRWRVGVERADGNVSL